MPLCSKCGKYEVSDMGLCRYCLAERSGKNTQTFEVFRDKYLTNTDAGIFWADDALLQYSYYTLDPDHILPLIEGEFGADYYAEHEKLRRWYAEQFTRIYSERLLAVSGKGCSPDEQEELYSLFADFHRAFHNFLAYAIDNQKISGMDIINIILKQKFRDFYEKPYYKNPRAYPTPDLVDVAADLFDVGSGLYFLEIFCLLQNRAYIWDIANYFSEEKPQDILRLSDQPRLLLYPWKHQKAALDSWVSRNHTGVIEMATATGKTVVGMLAIEELSKEANRTGKRKSVLITCHSTVILNQWRRELIRKMGIHAIPTQSYKYPLSSGKVTIRFETVQTLQKNYQNYRANLLIIDEVHHIAGAKFRQALNVNSPWQLGLTAYTGNNTKRRIIERELGDIVFQYPIKQALIDGIIPEFEWVVHPVYLAIKEEEEFRKISKNIVSSFTTVKYDVKTISRILGNKQSYVLQNIGEFVKLTEIARLKGISDIPEDWKVLQALLLKRRQIINKSIPRLEKAISLAKTLGNKHKIILFLMDIESCEIMRRELSGDVNNVFVIHSQIEENPIEVVEQFKKSKNGILIGAHMLNEGVDIPSADIGINVAFTKTELQLIQRMGRVLRKDGKKKPTFYQFVAIPDMRDYLDIMDAQKFVDDLAWVEATGLRMGLDLRIEWDSEELENYRSKIESFCAAVWRDENTPAKIGTFNLDAAMREFSKTAIKRIPQILSLYPNETITDAQWDDVIRVAHTVVEEGSTEIGNKYLNVSKAWYILVLCGRRVADLQKLFREAVSRIEASEQGGDEENHDIPLPELCLDENGFLKVVGEEEEEERELVIVDDIEEEEGERELVIVYDIEEEEEEEPVIVDDIEEEEEERELVIVDDIEEEEGEEEPVIVDDIEEEEEEEEPVIVDVKTEYPVMDKSPSPDKTELPDIQKILQEYKASAAPPETVKEEIEQPISETETEKKRPEIQEKKVTQVKPVRSTLRSSSYHKRINPAPLDVAPSTIHVKVTEELLKNHFFVVFRDNSLPSWMAEYDRIEKAKIRVRFNNKEYKMKIVQTKRGHFAFTWGILFNHMLKKLYKYTGGRCSFYILPINDNGVYVLRPKRDSRSEFPEKNDLDKELY